MNDSRMLMYKSNISIIIVRITFMTHACSCTKVIYQEDSKNDIHDSRMLMYKSNISTMIVRTTFMTHACSCTKVIYQ